MKLDAPGGDVQVTTRDGINTLWFSDLPDPDSIQPDIVDARRSDGGFAVCGGKRLDVEFRHEYDGRGFWVQVLGELPWRLSKDMCLENGTIKLRRRWTALPTCDGEPMPEHSDWVEFEFKGKWS